MQNLFDLMCSLSSATGVSGREDGISTLLAKYLEPLPSYTTGLGSLVCTTGPKDCKKHLVLVAHMDEIGFTVSYIDKTGFIKIAPVGGIDPKLMLGSALNIHTKNGDIPALVATTPPHLLGADSKTMPAIDEIYLDVGLTYEECTKKIALGDNATFISVPKKLGEDFCGKAVDDRAACAALILLMQKLAGKELNTKVSCVFSTQEELGSQGAKTATYTLNPTHAIALDTTFAHTPHTDKAKTGMTGAGPMIGISPVLDNKLTAALGETAKAENIPHQFEVMGGATGTDADKLLTTRQGVPTALVSIPIKYMHTPIEVVALRDIEETANLLAKFILSGNF